MRCLYSVYSGHPVWRTRYRNVTNVCTRRTRDAYPEQRRDLTSSSRDCREYSSLFVSVSLEMIFHECHTLTHYRPAMLIRPRHIRRSPLTDIGQLFVLFRPVIIRILIVYLADVCSVDPYHGGSANKMCGRKLRCLIIVR
jgi:hypothetical protein